MTISKFFAGFFSGLFLFAGALTVQAVTVDTVRTTYPTGVTNTTYYDQNGNPTATTGRSGCSGAKVRNLQGLFCYAKDIINYNIIPLIFMYALVMFFLGVVDYIQKPDLAAQARTKILYGIFGLAAMVSVWGLVNLVTSTFNLDNTPIQVQDIQIK